MYCVIYFLFVFWFWQSRSSIVLAVKTSPVVGLVFSSLPVCWPDCGLNDKHMSVDVISWLKSLPKNKPLCQHSPSNWIFIFQSWTPHFRPGDSYLYITCLWMNLRFAEEEKKKTKTKTQWHTIKAAFSFWFCSLTFAFLVFQHSSEPSAVLSGIV